MLPRFLPLLALLVPLSVQAKRDSSAEDAYQDARRSYYALKDDAARRKLRHNWLNVARKFESVANRFPKSPHNAESLYTAAELFNSLSRISFVPEDQQAAIADYTRVVEGHPRHKLADDAAVTLARIYFERLDQPEAARRVITGLMAVRTKGDRTSELKSILASLPPPPATRAAAPPHVKPTPRAAEPTTTVASAEPLPVIRVELSKPPPAPAASPSTVAPEESKPLEPKLAESKASEPKASESKASESKTSEKVAEPKLAEPKLAESKTAEPKTVEKVTEPKTAEKVTEPKLAEARPVESKPTESKAVEAKPGESLAEELRPSGPRSTEVLASIKPLTSPVNARTQQARLKAVAKASGAELTLAEQLGLKVRRVVIDAGHGGHDTGAIGKKGTQEKDVTLAIAQKVARALKAQGLEVMLTRDDDRYVKLEERARLANEMKGDLFISIHCNSAPTSKLRGIETYTLNTSSDRYSIRLAARENAASERGISDLQFILADLATKANTEESTRLATQVQKSLVNRLSQDYAGVKDLGTKEALFYVLLGARMPAILVETSFLSHPEEEKRLGSDSYQEDVARSIAQGVEDFVGVRRQVASQMQVQVD